MIGATKIPAGDGEILKTVVTSTLSQNNGVSPTDGVECVIHYKVLLDDGVEFDSTYAKNLPFHFILGDQQVHPNIESAVKSMNVGEEAVFVMPSPSPFSKIPTAAPNLSSSINPEIECKTGPTVEIQVKLLNLLEKHTIASSLAWDERLHLALKKMTRGHDCLERKLIEKAIENYQKVIEVTEDYGKEETQLRPTKFYQIRLSAHLNLARCYIAVQSFSKAISHATAALQLSPDNCKALYRRGVAYLHDGKHNEAKSDLMRAARMEPFNREIRRQYQQLKKCMLEDSLKAKSIYGSLFEKNVNNTGAK